jgi:hypothetical protein
VPKSRSAETDLDLIGYIKAVLDAPMRRGVRIQAWYSLLVAVLGIISSCQTLRDLVRHSLRRRLRLCHQLCELT